MLVEQNTVGVEEREREIRQIVQSISDLNEIFRDLAGMVVEQVCDEEIVPERRSPWPHANLFFASLPHNLTSTGSRLNPDHVLGS